MSATVLGFLVGLLPPPRFPRPTPALVSHPPPSSRGPAVRLYQRGRDCASVVFLRFGGPSHGTSSVADSCLRNSSGVILRNSQKLNAGNFRPNKPYGV